MNIGERYIVTGNNSSHQFKTGEIVELIYCDETGWYGSTSDRCFWWVNPKDLVKAHQIYENGQLKWVGPHYIMSCERGDSIEEKTYERPSDFKIDDGVVIFDKNSAIKLVDQYNFSPTISEVDDDDFSNKEHWEEILKSFRIEIGDQVDITCFGNSRVRGKVIGIVDKRFEVEFRGCKGLFYLNELVKI